MTVSIKDAMKMSVALKQASIDSPILQIRSELDARAEEWADAVQLVSDHATINDDGPTHPAVIEMVANVGRGMRALHMEHGFVKIVRRVDGRDSISLHLESPRDPRGIYVNLLDSTSPVVVRGL